MTTTGTRAGSPLRTGDPRFGAPREVDVLIPTRDRAAELAVTLSGLAAQEGVPDFGVAVSDQSDGDPPWATPAVAAAVRILRHRGRPVLLERHLPARGLAEQRLALGDQRIELAEQVAFGRHCFGRLGRGVGGGGGFGHRFGLSVPGRAVRRS